MFNNAYQNLELKIDLASGGTIAGLKEKIKSILGNKILILCGLLISGVQQLPAVCEPNIYVTQTEEPEDWDEEEDGEFAPEDVYHLEASNIYGYDIAIEDNVVTCTATQSATYSGVETLIEGGTLDNAKPIYCHPISITASSGRYENTRAICLLFDNSSEAYTKTTFNELMSTFVGRMLLNGTIIDGGNLVNIAAYIAGGNIVTNRADTGAVEIIALTGFLSTEGVEVTDNVNKIN